MVLRRDLRPDMGQLRSHKPEHGVTELRRRDLACHLDGASGVQVTWPDRVRFLAHEFTHTIQFDLAGGRHGSSQQWLREG